MATIGFNSTILQPVSITSGPVVNVSQFGAVGDGKKDDTAAIQSALNYVKANGGALNFDSGHTYIVSKNLVISGADDFKLDGNGATIKMANGTPVKSGYGILRIENSDNFAVTELTFDGNRATRSPAEVSAHNVIIKNAENFSFSKVDSINAVTDGFYLSAIDPANRSTYTQNGLFLDCRADNGFRQGMSIINGTNIQVIGGAFTNSHGTDPAAGIDVEANDGTAIPGNQNILIQGVKFTGNEGFGVQLSSKGSPTNITVKGCYFTDNDGGAINLGTAYTLIKENTFENFSEAVRGVIDLTASLTNSNNVITENSFNHIGTGQAVIFAHRYSGTNNKVYGNDFHDIDGPMVFSGTAGMTAWDNVITSSPTYPTASQEPAPDPAPTPAPEPAPAPAPEPTPAPAPEPAPSGNVINGTSGDDLLVATAKAETIDGHEGTDRISYLNSSSAVTVKLWSGTGAGGHAEGDKLISIEKAMGSNYNDRLEGTDSDNRLDGVGGNDVLLARGGKDLMSGGPGADTLYGGDGKDYIYGNGGADVLHGEAGDDRLYGQEDSDTLLGLNGKDVLWGEDGNDILIGGADNDRLIGGKGADRYVFDAAGTGNDTIEGFDVTSDKVVLKANLNGNGIGTAAQADAHVHAGANGNAVLDLGNGNTVTFVGVTPTQIAADDFVIA